MQGWNLSEGFKPFNDLDDLAVISLVNKALGSGVARTTSYKFGFFKSLLDNLFNVDEKDHSLSFNTIFTTFSETYYNLIVKWNISQISGKNNSVSSVRKIIDAFILKYPEINVEFIPFDSLKSSLQVELIKKIESEGKKYVIGAFYGDTEGQLYQFSKKEHKIWINPGVYRILMRLKNTFEKMNYFEWMKFLEKCNDDDKLNSLSNKIDNSTKRSNLNLYRNFLLLNGQHRCAYCGKEISRLENNTPVDHIIPWSFVKDDRLWNLTLTCQTCNSKKSNKLPLRDYIIITEKRNDIILLKYENKDLVENKELVKKDFKNYTNKKYDNIYDSAIFNGLDRDWHSSKYINSINSEEWQKIF
ncbi:MAG: HNH endonuclease [Spirochaetaceae bacterium]|nr:HNH endonuclease [Spirochaetaceae bacterium]